MLSRLKIKNLALVDDAQIEFREGLNVITGETGAGKSLLIGALRLLLGERADKSMIRSGESTCSVFALFELRNPKPINEFLTEKGLEPCDGGQLFIRRTITESSNKTLVNDEPVTLHILRELGTLLVDLHGPYDHQSLLDPATQLHILDAFGELEPARRKYKKVYDRYMTLQHEIDALNSDNDEDLDRQIEFLDYRIQEIESAALSADEEEEVEKEHSAMANAQAIIENSNGAVQALTDGEGCVFDGLIAAQQALKNLQKFVPEASDWHDEIEHTVTSIREISYSVESMAEEIDASSERMQWLDDRLSTYRTLCRKYGSSVEEVLKNGEQWKEQLKKLRGRDREKEKLILEQNKVLREVEQRGEALRSQRENVAKKLATSITHELSDIGFEHGFFEIHLRPCSPKSSGIDDVEFGFAPNIGEEMRPLRMIASSGEISRVMLATKAILARHDQIPLLVFDEIDANVGGEIGGAVGKKLAEVAKHHQLICITHLPQVAACGETHLAVSKAVHAGRTFTEVRLLTPLERPLEIARMLGGNSDLALRHAQEMLNF